MEKYTREAARNVSTQNSEGTQMRVSSKYWAVLEDGGPENVITVEYEGDRGKIELFGSAGKRPIVLSTKAQ